MTYKTQLKPWCIIRLLPDLQSKFIIRFRNRSDAEGHLRILRINNRTACYEIIFDVMPEPTNWTTKPESFNSAQTLNETVSKAVSQQNSETSELAAI
jgi:hypothetical protein